MGATPEPDPPLFPDELVASAGERPVLETFLDGVAPHFRMGQVSLRWIYVHIIEETARHAGHADILREQLDGSTGT